MDPFPDSVPTLYTANDLYKPKPTASWLRSGFDKLRFAKPRGPKSGIRKAERAKKRLSKKNSPWDVKDDSNKADQRIKSVHYTFLNGGLVIILDSEIFHVYNVILANLRKMVESGITIPKNLRIICVNGNTDAILPESNEFNMKAVIADIYTVVEELSDGEEVKLLWNDSLSSIKNRFRNKFSSTEELFKLMCQKRLFNDTILMWNASWGRKNRNGENNKDGYEYIHDQFNIASDIFVNMGYTTTFVSERQDLKLKKYTNTKGCSVKLHDYRDRNSEYIYHECIVKLE
jgi:hypothetical protein